MKTAHFLGRYPEGERGREGVEREAPTSLYDLRRSGGCLPKGQGLKSEYSVRAMRGYQKLQVLPRFRAEGFAKLPRVITHTSRGRETSYFDLFSIYESFLVLLEPYAKNVFSGILG